MVVKLFFAIILNTFDIFLWPFYLNYSQLLKNIVTDDGQYMITIYG